MRVHEHLGGTSVRAHSQERKTARKSHPKRRALTTNEQDEIGRAIAKALYLQILTPLQEARSRLDASMVSDRMPHASVVSRVKSLTETKAKPRCMRARRSSAASTTRVWHSAWVDPRATAW